MIGGTVVEIIQLEDKIWLNCEEETKPKWDDKNYKVNQCGVFVEKTAASKCVQIYDSIWWQGENVMWTPNKHRDNPKLKDYKLKKIGNSGVKRPNVTDKELVEVAK